MTFILILNFNLKSKLETLNSSPQPKYKLQIMIFHNVKNGWVLSAKITEKTQAKTNLIFKNSQHFVINLSMKKKMAVIFLNWHEKHNHFFVELFNKIEQCISN